MRGMHPRCPVVGPGPTPFDVLLKVFTSDADGTPLPAESVVGELARRTKGVHRAGRHPKLGRRFFYGEEVGPEGERVGRRDLHHDRTNNKRTTGLDACGPFFVGSRGQTRAEWRGFRGIHRFPLNLRAILGIYSGCTPPSFRPRVFAPLKERDCLWSLARKPESGSLRSTRSGVADPDGSWCATRLAAGRVPSGPLFQWEVPHAPSAQVEAWTRVRRPTTALVDDGPEAVGSVSVGACRGATPPADWAAEVTENARAGVGSHPSGAGVVVDGEPGHINEDG